LWNAVQEDWIQNLLAFRACFQAMKAFPASTWATVTFNDRMTVYLAKRRLISCLWARPITAGDIVAMLYQNCHASPWTIFRGKKFIFPPPPALRRWPFHDWPVTLAKKSAIGIWMPFAPGRGRCAGWAHKWSMARWIHADFVTSTLSQCSAALPWLVGFPERSNYEACRARLRTGKFGDY